MCFVLLLVTVLSLVDVDTSHVYVFDISDSNDKLDDNLTYVMYFIRLKSYLAQWLDDEEGLQADL